MTHVTKSKYARAGGSHNINLLTPTGRRAVDIRLVKIVYLCFHCLGKLKYHNAGVQCEQNSNHYGFIHRDEAKDMTDEERFMKLSDMFPSEYFRGIDIGKPFIVTIKGVAAEQVRNRDNNKVEQEFVMRFEEVDKKLRLNVTMAKEVAKIVNDPEMDTDNWVGRRVTIYRTTIKAFGQEHIVPRIRQPERSDVDLGKAIKQAQPAKSKPANEGRANEEQSPEPNGNGKAKAPTTGDELLALVNSRVLVTYDSAYHLRNAIRLELHNNKWDFPKPDDRAGWEEAFKMAKQHADSKTTEAGPAETEKPF